MHTAGHLRIRCVLGFALLAVATVPGVARAEGEALVPRHGVVGNELTEVERDGEVVAWSAIDALREPGVVELRWRVSAHAGDAMEIPVCAGRGALSLDGAPVPFPDAGPVTVPLSEGQHVVSAQVTVGRYERRVACGSAPRVGPLAELREGLLRFAYSSPRAPDGSRRGVADAGHAVLFVPPHHDSHVAGAALVMPYPWNGSIWTYAAYRELLDEAATRDVVLLFPSGLGNSLYTVEAEDEVIRALDALGHVIAVDPLRVSIAGASMGGAGATTIAFHRPDRFAGVTSFFGDAKYDLGTYVRGLLHDERGAHAVNAVDVADNARWLPVWLVHGEDDKTSPIFQSEVLARALRQRSFAVRFDRVPAFGHSGALVARYARDVVKRASEARAPRFPSRVTFASVRARDLGAYGVTIERKHQGDAFVDVERTDDGNVHVHRAGNVRSITLDPGALGARFGAPVSLDDAANGVTVRWAR